MKKIITSILLAALVLTGCGGNAKKPATTTEKEMDCNTLKVFNWGEYVGEDVLANFEDKYGIDVIYEMYDSNESMYTKLQSGEKYDVLVPSDYMIQRLIEENYLQPLNFDLITNFDGVIEGLKNPSYDPANEYSVPYLWGTVGILYNTKVISEEEISSQGWNILKNEKYRGRVYMYDSERDAFMVALKALGYSMNTDNQKEIDQATKWLEELDKNVDPVYVTDEVIDAMASGTKDLAVVYSGEATYVTYQNPDMAYFTPNEGTNVWVDAMVIPSDSACPIAANTFINYMLEEDVAYENTVYVGYTSTVQKTYDEVIAAGGEFEGLLAYQPRLGYEKDETFKHNEVLKKALSQLWIKIKAQ